MSESPAEDFTPQGDPAPEQPQDQAPARKRPTPKRPARRGKAANVDAATVRLVLGTHERVRKAGPDIRDAAARVLRAGEGNEALTEAILGADDTHAKALGDLLAVARDNFEAAMVDLAALESDDKVRAIWQVLGAVQGEAAGKLPANSLSAALQVARGVAGASHADWTRAERVSELLEA